MGRLGQMPSRFAGSDHAGQRLSKVFKDRSEQRRTVSRWRGWYNTKAWRDLRWSVLVDEMFTCRRCGFTGDSPVMVADHIKPHRGNRDLFFDRNNLQCLCKQCHDRDKQKEERGHG